MTPKYLPISPQTFFQTHFPHPFFFRKQKSPVPCKGRSHLRDTTQFPAGLAAHRLSQRTNIRVSTNGDQPYGLIFASVRLFREDFPFGQAAGSHHLPALWRHASRKYSFPSSDFLMQLSCFSLKSMPLSYEDKGILSRKFLLYRKNFFKGPITVTNMAETSWPGPGK